MEPSQTGPFCNGYIDTTYHKYSDVIQTGQEYTNFYNMWDLERTDSVTGVNYYDLTFICNMNDKAKKICGYDDTPDTDIIPGFFVRKVTFKSDYSTSTPLYPSTLDMDFIACFRYDLTSDSTNSF